MPWFWDLVTMSSQIPLSLPNLPNLLTQPFNQISPKNLTNLNLHAWLLEPQQSKSRASLKQWQQGLRLLKGDQPDLSVRQSGPFLQSGALLIRWTSGHPLYSQLLTSLCTFLRTGSYSPAPLMVTDRPLLMNWEVQPSTSAKMKISLVSWIASIETDPRVEGVSWNLSLVLHQLTKAPFEPIKEASLKHLTFKTVFLLGLGSGKRRSEIHAWQNRNIRH